MRRRVCTRPRVSLISTRHDESRIQRQYVNQYSVLSARTGFKPWRLSRMEIYETISHVSTNQVWLHINSASSRVYFRPFALFSFVARGGRAGQLARSYLPLGSLTPPSPPRSFALASFFFAPRHSPFRLPYSSYTWYARYS